MKFNDNSMQAPSDSWVWGDEQILWGYDPTHEYTIKILKPKVGRDGCLSLQYHHKKSESWMVLSGTAWAVIIQGENVITRVMNRGDFQNLPTGTIHRLMGVSEDASILECSTPDMHAADKSAEKDVVRLHCVHGRECVTESNPEKSAQISLAIQYSEEAIQHLESGQTPPQINREKLIGSVQIPF